MTKRGFAMLAILIFGVFGTRAANAQQPEDQPPVDQQAPPDAQQPPPGAAAAWPAAPTSAPDR